MERLYLEIMENVIHARLHVLLDRWEASVEQVLRNLAAANAAEEETIAKYRSQYR